MSAFPDTSFLCSLYRRQVHSPRAIAFMADRDAPLAISSLLLLEFQQSLRLQTRLHAIDRTKGIPRHEAGVMQRFFQSDLSAHVLQVVAVDWSDVHHLAENLSSRHTAARGHRLTDILHVATALHLGAAEFLTFDANQKLLAEAEGLRVKV